MQKNPHVEICTSDGKGFLRYYGKAVFDDNPAVVKRAFEEADRDRGISSSIKVQIKQN